LDAYIKYKFVEFFLVNLFKREQLLIRKIA